MIKRKHHVCAITGPTFQMNQVISLKVDLRIIQLKRAAICNMLPTSSNACFNLAQTSKAFE
ncbi:hypothetical protein [Acinetobacter junii]|uniref:hypothetical protein n=1 Tax=Acinetobacter junii TaxID=40215 RepID=UPI001F312485|nr:hypothetical protein [Acinetobacter junii]